MKIFISHITEEASIAIVIKNWIESTFLGNVEVFVSSSNTSIQLGSKWLEQIDKAIEESSVFIVLCSEKSVLRPWINFESGCAWIKKVPLIPICHTGISKSELPAPLSFFQAVNITEANFSESLFEFLASQLNIVKLPRIAYDEMKSEINNALLNINYDEVEKNAQKASDKHVFQKNKENVKTIYNPLGGKTVIVASDGTGDYFSIQHAIDELGVYDQIYIKAGIYDEEYIQLNGKRDFRILGESRETVLIYGNISINAYSVDLSDLNIISKRRNGVCINVMSGKNKITNNKFSRGRDGIMIQRFNDFKMESESIIQDNIFFDNGIGLWIGISGRAIIERNTFQNNVFGILNSETLSQTKQEICESNTFDKNHRADYVSKWDYQDGTMSNFSKVINGAPVEIELPEHLRKLKDSIYDIIQTKASR